MKLYTPLLGSAICLGIGGILLFHVVPLLISLGTLVAVIVLLLTSVAIAKGFKTGEYVGLAVSILAILGSASSTTHDNSLLKFGTSLFISVLDVLMVLGFYIFPVLYIILFAKKLKRSMTYK